MLQLNPRIITNLIIYHFDWLGSGLIKADEVYYPDDKINHVSQQLLAFPSWE